MLVLETIYYREKIWIVQEIQHYAASVPHFLVVQLVLLNSNVPIQLSYPVFNLSAFTTYVSG